MPAVSPASAGHTCTRCRKADRYHSGVHQPALRQPLRRHPPERSAASRFTSSVASTRVLDRFRPHPDGLDDDRKSLLRKGREHPMEIRRHLATRVGGRRCVAIAKELLADALAVRAAAGNRSSHCRVPMGPKAVGPARVDTQKTRAVWLPGMLIAAWRAGVTRRDSTPQM